MPQSISPILNCLMAGIVLVLGLGCDQERQPDPAAPSQSDERLFSDVSDASGLQFHHVSGRSPEYRFYEIVGSGAALFDFDNDGDLDVYLIQSHRWDHSGKQPVPEQPLVSDRLFRNDSEQGTSDGKLKFTDVTHASGLAGATGYGQGVACGDYDNDGDVDLYVTNFGPNQLWRNNGDGTFTDATELTRTNSGRWSSSAAFVDYDRDGWLDLYVCNYVDFSFETEKPCFGANGTRDYCGPSSFRGEPDKLFRNNGNGEFSDVSTEAGITSLDGPGLGVVCADFDGDRWPDIYVTNDGTPNRLWTNQRDGTFRDTALLSGCAFNGTGVAEAGMGVDAADCDDDQDEDLFMAHLTNETNTLYLNDGRGSFSDRTNLANLGACSQSMTGFGASWIDFDHDGRLDLLVVNGTVKRENSAISSSDVYPRGQANQLFRNEGRAFRDISSQVDETFLLAEMSRGLAVGDLDSDGDLDFVVMNNEGQTRLYRNDVGHKNRWIGLKLVDAEATRVQLGSAACLHLDDGSIIRRRARRDGSYCSSRDPRIQFGIPEGRIPSRVEVHWVDGTTESFAAPEIGQYTELRQGSGEGGPT